MKLANKVAIVTGGTRGIGRSITEAFLREGARVLIAGRSKESGQKTLDELKSGDRLQFQVTDVCIQAQAESLVDEAVRRFGRLDILINNAGGEARFATLDKISDELWKEIMDLNLSGPFWTCRKALQHMIPAKTGRIINISSGLGKMGFPGLSAYSAAKHGINGLTKSLAHEVGQLGITANTICPGVVTSDLSANMAAVMGEGTGTSADNVLQTILNTTALKRPLFPSELTGLAVLLASDDGSGITGMQLSIDGGWTQY